MDEVVRRPTGLVEAVGQGRGCAGPGLVVREGQVVRRAPRGGLMAVRAKVGRWGPGRSAGIGWIEGRIIGGREVRVVRVVQEDRARREALKVEGPLRQGGAIGPKVPGLEAAREQGREGRSPGGLVRIFR